MSKRSKKGGLKNPPAVEVPKDQITQNTLCQFCHMGETKDILQSGRLYKLTSGKTTEYYHYFCLLFSRLVFSPCLFILLTLCLQSWCSEGEGRGGSEWFPRGRHQEGGEEGRVNKMRLL